MTHGARRNYAVDPMFFASTKRFLVISIAIFPFVIISEAPQHRVLSG